MRRPERLRALIFRVVPAPLCALLFSATAWAGTKQQTYSAPFDDVWDACVRAASEKFTLDHSDKASGVLSFSVERSVAETILFGLRASPTAARGSVTVKRQGENQTVVVLNLQRRAGRGVADKFFLAVQVNLAGKLAPAKADTDSKEATPE